MRRNETEAGARADEATAWDAGAPVPVIIFFFIVIIFFFSLSLSLHHTRRPVKS